MTLVDSLAVKYMKMNQKQSISFCCLLLINVQQGGETKSLGIMAYHRPTVTLQMGWYDNYDCLST